MSGISGRSSSRRILFINPDILLVSTIILRLFTLHGAMHVTSDRGIRVQKGNRLHSAGLAGKSGIHRLSVTAAFAIIRCKGQKVSNGSESRQVAQTAEGPCAAPKEMLRARYLAADF